MIEGLRKGRKGRGEVGGVRKGRAERDEVHFKVTCHSYSLI